MEIFTIIGLIGFSVRLWYKSTGLLFLWWRKEYRIDRMMIHLRTLQGKVLWGGRTHAVLYALLFLWIAYPKSVVLTLLAVCIGMIGGTYIVKHRSVNIPPVSPKVVTLFGGTILFIGALLYSGAFPVLIALLLADIFLFPLTMIMVLFVTLPTMWYHRMIIRKAVNKLRSHTPMTVIGITGSYGKTSVKEYLSTILSSKYKVLCTEASKNSPIGIAETIVSTLRTDHEIFVVEMGAYRPGEIARMCAMVQPEIGVITAINPQHQDLFGSLDNTMKAKYELATGLVGRRILIANASDLHVRVMGEWAKHDGCTVVWFSKEKNAKNSMSALTGTRFDCVIGKETAHVETRVIGEHQVSNIVAAIVAATQYGMTLKDAAMAARAIAPAKGVMEITKGINGSIFIDDTFNNHPDAAKAAISFLAKNKGKHIIVFQPMIELGAYAETSHEDVGYEAGKCADAIFVTNGNWFSSFEKGVRRASTSVPLSVTEPQNIADYIRANVKKGDMVLFKGKDAKHALDLLG